MKKQSKLFLRFLKAAVKLAEAGEKKPQTWEEYVLGTSRSCCHEIVVPRHLRAGGYTPNTDATGTPPRGKNSTYDELCAERLRELTDPAKESTRKNRNTLRWFAQEDTPLVEKMLDGLLTDSARLVHVKCPALGTETLVVLSPEGDVLTKIVKDNSRKYVKR